MPKVMAEGESMLVRYRFDTLEHLAQHLEVTPTATLLFVSELRIAASRVQTVLVELSVHETRQHTVVRGEPVAEPLEAPPGAWLELSEHHLPRLARPRGPFMARRDPRVNGHQRLKLRGHLGEELVAELLDVSAGGLRVRSPCALLAGDTYLVRLMDAPPSGADLGPAQVVRSGGGEAGLRFAAPGTVQVMRYLGSLRGAWLRALDFQHHPRRCAEGGLRMPPLLELRRKSAQTSNR